MKSKITYFISAILIIVSLFLFISSYQIKIDIDEVLQSDSVGGISVIFLMMFGISGVVIGFILSLITFIINIIQLKKVTNKTGNLIFAILGFLLIISNIVLFILLF